ncbi:MAG: hypothetical protein KJ779_04240 [Firmicutes bacterium]|nr:hypothetical protein [Bacillota bacterium]
MNKKMPVLFVGHGSPMNAIENNEYTRGWEEIAAKIPKPKAILSISAHWYTNGTKTNDSTKNFINDLLGESEKIVLAKRLSIVFMLQENISWYRISTLLKVSDTTVKKIAVKIDRGGYKNILKIVKQKKNRRAFWTGMEVIVRCGMPPIVGKGRWNFLDELYGKYDLKK